MLRATRLRMCRKHRVWFAGPGNFSISFASSTIIVSFTEALSHEILRIYGYDVKTVAKSYYCTCCAYFVADPKLIQDISKSHCKIQTRVRHGNLNEVQQ